MKRLSIAILTALSAVNTLVALPVMAEQEQATATQSEALSYSDAELDSVLAPIALYPDTILTHILIASTYPLDIVSADRWRQQNSELSEDEIQEQTESFNWDPSVKALLPLTDILHTLASDLDWLQQLGDNVLISQSRVLARVQVLRQHALNAGTLSDNEYLDVEQDEDVIVIEPTRKEYIYVPFYDTRVVFGHWWHPVAPVYWHQPAHFRLAGSFYWSPRIHLSTTFYFGGILWHNRQVVVNHKPVKRFYYGKDVKRVYSRDYQPWQHNTAHRHVRYSPRVIHSAPTHFATPRVVKKPIRSPTKVTTTVTRRNTERGVTVRKETTVKKPVTVRQEAVRKETTVKKPVTVRQEAVRRETTVKKPVTVRREVVRKETTVKKPATVRREVVRSAPQQKRTTPAAVKKRQTVQQPKQPKGKNRDHN
ncbi:DUF3300 domain-containing protein [Alteromonas sp. 14N.309.X.WAT.G.H12]|uniref:DUF3300 domain-containing protein n=1 Tax=Alteromonas sp. 14N.309.X.WAT.G.H12 TaxID=3120824 RepID=UPI002FCFFB2A